jgi:hypothetical protein
MPKSRVEAINFLETQWSSITDNKIIGILAELRFKSFLKANNSHFIEGGWIMIPADNSIHPIPTKEKICLLPLSHRFSWEPPGPPQVPSLSGVAAYNYFRQVGMRACFTKPTGVVEANFQLPTRSSIRRQPAKYPLPYGLEFLEISPSGALQLVPFSQVFANFPKRTTLGSRLRVNSTARIDATKQPWINDSVVAGLFWTEYSKYYVQLHHRTANNDLDLFLIGQSGSAYPTEMKSKTPVPDSSLGDWFGIDSGPYAKLAFFTANSMHTDALFVVEEVDQSRNHVAWWGIRFTDLVKSCSWVPQPGGQNMGGGGSSTYRVPKKAFSPLTSLIPSL